MKKNFLSVGGEPEMLGHVRAAKNRPIGQGCSREVLTATREAALGIGLNKKLSEDGPL